MAAFGAVGEYATTEFETATVVLVVTSETFGVAILEVSRRFVPTTIGDGELIEVLPEDRTIIVPADRRDLRPVTLGS